MREKYSCLLWLLIICASCSPLVSPADPGAVIGTAFPEQQGVVRAASWDTRFRGCCTFPFEPKEKFAAAVQVYRMNLIQILCGDDEYDLSADSPDHFLYGDINNFTTLRAQDVATVKQVSAWCGELGCKLVIDLHHGPGRKWGEESDYRLHEDYTYHTMLSNFWVQMTYQFLGDTNVAAFNILDEPHYFEKMLENYSFDYGGLPYVSDDVIRYYVEHTQGTPADLNAMYKKVVGAIHAIDPTRYVTVECDNWGSPDFLRALSPVSNESGADPYVIYEAHFYEPNELTHQTGCIASRYPGAVVASWGSERWDKSKIESYLNLVEQWRVAYGIPASRIFIGEFGVCRWAAGAEDWLRDVSDIVESLGYHWTYYAFREDTWSVMDLELGPNRLNKTRYFSPLMQILYSRFTENQ